MLNRIHVDLRKPISLQEFIDNCRTVGQLVECLEKKEENQDLNEEKETPQKIRRLNKASSEVYACIPCSQLPCQYKFLIRRDVDIEAFKRTVEKLQWRHVGLRSRVVETSIRSIYQSVYDTTTTLNLLREIFQKYSELEKSVQFFSFDYHKKKLLIEKRNKENNNTCSS